MNSGLRRRVNSKAVSLLNEAPHHKGVGGIRAELHACLNSALSEVSGQFLNPVASLLVSRG
jgi:hypothetical protein